MRPVWHCSNTSKCFTTANVVTPPWTTIAQPSTKPPSPNSRPAPTVLGEGHTSAFSLAEVVGLDTSKPVSREDATKIKEFFENPYIKLRAVDRGTVEHAADIGRMSKISPPDAVHIATCIRAGCRLLLTYD